MINNVNDFVSLSLTAVSGASGYDILDEIAEGVDMFNPPFPMLYQTQEEIFAQGVIIIMILVFIAVFVFPLILMKKITRFMQQKKIEMHDLNV